MLNELTSKQCDAYFWTRFTIRDVRLRIANGDWQCFEPPRDGSGVILRSRRGKTREEAITKYQQRYDPDWTPPVIHDEAWALRYVREYTLCFGRRRVWEAAYSNNGVNIDDGLTTVGAVLKWKAKYDPDKPEPTREETAMGLLRKVVKADETDGGNFETLVRALTKAREFIDRQETDHVD